MRRTLALAGAALLASPSAAFAQSLCRAGETTYFSCPTAQHKTISVCGSVPSALQYRYGTASRMELAFPRDPAVGARQLDYAHYTRYQTDRTEVGFSRAGVDYAVFDYDEGGRRSAGVRVTTTDGTERVVACAGAVDGRLDTLAQSLRCDPDNALNGGSCP